MLENQFIQIRFHAMWAAKNQKPLACPLYEQEDFYYIFYVPSPSGSTPVSIAIVDENDSVIGELEENLLDGDGWIEIMGGQGSYFEEAEEKIEIGQKFFLRLKTTRNGSTYYQYSQPLICAPKDGFSTLRYLGYEDIFGFPFKTVSDIRQEYCIASMPLPIRLHSPQNVQDDKTYVKANGEVVTLYAKYYKEWEGETEYLSEEMHDKIVAALSCDEVYIDGKRVTKSDKYQVDWENYDLDCDGVTKLARATFKVRENITQRNSNY